jgi:NADPH:quinone reductase-like Zn-dependent oxidoreductase
MEEVVRGYVLQRYGDASAMSLREVPEPEAGPGQVLVRVHAAGLNPIDYKVREGKVRLINRLRLPLVAGSELSGVVTRTGPGVARFAAGDRVFARLDKTMLGAFADYAAVDEHLLAAVPDELDLGQAAGMPLAGLTALQALRDELGVGPGGRLYISGGAGGVGTMAIQIAKWLGAEVATTASGRGVELVRELGADHVVDYKKEKAGDVLNGYDYAFDLIGGDELSEAFRVVKPGGTVVSIAAVPEPTTARRDLGRGPLLAALFWLASAAVRRQAGSRRISYRYLLMHPSGADLEVLAGLAQRGALSVTVDRVFPFSQIPDAFAYLEKGRAKGKVIVEMAA